MAGAEPNGYELLFFNLFVLCVLLCLFACLFLCVFAGLKRVAPCSPKKDRPTYWKVHSIDATRPALRQGGGERMMLGMHCAG